MMPPFMMKVDSVLLAPNSAFGSPAVPLSRNVPPFMMTLPEPVPAPTSPRWIPPNVRVPSVANIVAVLPLSITAMSVGSAPGTVPASQYEGSKKFPSPPVQVLIVCALAAMQPPSTVHAIALIRVLLVFMGNLITRFLFVANDAPPVGADTALDSPPCQLLGITLLSIKRVYG